MKLQLIIAIVLINVLKAGSVLAVKLGLRELPALLSAGIRFTTAGLLLALVALTLRALVRRRHGAPGGRLASVGLAGVSLLITIAYTFYYLSLTLTAVSRAGIIVNLNPLLTAVFAALFLKERLSRPQLAGLLVAFSGVVVLETGGDGLHGGVLLGDLLMVACCVAWSGAAVLKKHVSAYADPTVITAWEVLPGGMLLLAVSAAAEPWSSVTWGPTALLSLGYLILIGTVLAFAGYTWVLQKSSASVVTGFSFVVPITAVILGVGILDEPLGWRLIAAVCLVVVGLGLLSFRRRSEDSNAARGGVV